MHSESIGRCGCAQYPDKAGRVVFPNIGPMSDDGFINLVGHALRSGYRVYLKDLPPGQAAVPVVKTNGSVTLLVSSEFRAHVQRLRAEYKQKRSRGVPSFDRFPR